MDDGGAYLPRLDVAVGSTTNSLLHGELNGDHDGLMPATTE